MGLANYIPHARSHWHNNIMYVLHCTVMYTLRFYHHLPPPQIYLVSVKMFVSLNLLMFTNQIENLDAD